MTVGSHDSRPLVVQMWCNSGASGPRRRYLQHVPRNASDLPSDPVIVVRNPDDDCSPSAFRVLLDELLEGPEPALDSIGAAAALRELRVDAGA